LFEREPRQILETVGHHAAGSTRICCSTASTIKPARKPPVRGRSREELLRYFDGLELLDPGLVSVSQWRPEPSDIGTPAEVYEFCGVAHKP
jgi:hypothetical protein